MGLIKNLGEYLALKREEKAVVRELNKKRALKQKVFHTMLDKRFPCDKIIGLKNEDGQVEYFLMDIKPLVAILFFKQGLPPTIKFKQLTGKDAGKVYEECKLTNEVYGASRAIEMGCQVGLFDLTDDGSKLKVTINGYQNNNIDQHWCEDTELEKIYGKTMTLRQLLMRWKSDNDELIHINMDNDYDMVKSLYDSEDILKEDKEQTINK